MKTSLVNTFYAVILLAGFAIITFIFFFFFYVARGYV